MVKYYQKDALIMKRGAKKGFLKNLMAIILFFLLLLAGAAFAGFWVFNKYLWQNEKTTVAIEITGDTEVPSGKEIKYEVKYRNDSKIAIKTADLVITFAQGFSGISSVPEAEEGVDTLKQTWHFKDIAPNQEGTIKIIGKLAGEAGTEKELSAVLIYVPENFNSEFKESNQLAIKLLPSEVEFSFDGNTTSFLDAENEYNVVLKNLSDAMLTDLKLELTPVNGFSMTESLPVMTDGALIVEKLAPKEEYKVKFKGKFSGVDPTPKTLLLKLLIKAQDDNYYLQEEKSLEIQLQNNEDLALTLLENGATESTPLNFGQKIDYSLAFENNSGQSLGDVSVQAILKQNNATLLNLEDLSDANGGVLSKDGDNVVITWNKDKFKKLASLADKDKGVITFSVPIQERSLVTGDAKSLGALSLESSFKVVVSKIDGKAAKLERTSGVLINKINSDLVFKTSKSEPMPSLLEAGTTNFQIFWMVSNTTHEVENLEIKAHLPEGVVWTDRSNVSAGTLTFDSKTRIVKWQLNRYPVGLTEPIKVDFEIKIDNALSSIGQTLIDESVLSSKDKVTGGKISLKQPMMSYKK